MLSLPNAKTEEEIELEETLTFSATEVEAQAKADLNFLAALAIPEVYESPFPNFYHGLWSYTTKAALDQARAIYQLAIGLPRGHGKTTWVKLVVLYILLFTTRSYILVIGSNSTRAEAIIADIITMLDSWNIQTVFGNWREGIEKDRQDEKVFYFRGRVIILQAAGQGTAVRGANKNFKRPDVIVLDDAQTSQSAASETESESFASWFWGDIYKAKDAKRCLFIYIGNMYPDKELRKDTNSSGSTKVYTCMLRNLQLSPSWLTFITGGLQADGTALWEDVQPKAQLLRELQQDFDSGRAHIFFAEVQNDPNPRISSVVDVTKFTSHDPPENELSDYHQGSFIVLDPATSKETRDMFVINYVEILDNVPHIQTIIDEKLTAPEAVWKVIHLAMEKQCSTIIVEANAYQYSLIDWFDFVLGQMNITGFNILPLYSNKNKTTRILECFKELIAGRISVSKTYLRKVQSQALEFDPKKTDNVDDILDAIHMAWRSQVKFARYLESRLGENIHHQTQRQTIQNTPTTPHCPY